MNTTSLVRHLSFRVIACTCGVCVVQAAPVFEVLQAVSGTPIRRESKLCQAPDGSLYGVTITGGTSNFGTLFKLAPDRTFSILQNFSMAGGNWNARAPLVQGPESDFYGSTGNGGASNNGRIFKMTPSGVLTTLHDFNRTDGYFPVGSLVKADDGFFYGVTNGGGTSDLGSVFRMYGGGSITTIQSLNNATGTSPNAGLTKGADHTLYGIATYGGTYGQGTIFKINPLGALSVLVNFNGPNGSYPASELVRTADGNFYGTTNGGGTNNDGTAFVMTPEGKLTTLCSFSDGLGAKYTQIGLTPGPDGNFYSLTNNDGTSKMGTLYRLTPGGTQSVIINFNGTNGRLPDAPLAVGADGNLYGTTSAGGKTTSGQTVDGGQIFRLRFGPGVVTKEATKILTTHCYVRGSVNPGLLPTQFWIQYGTRPTLDLSSSSWKSTISGNNHDNTLQIGLSGLRPGTTYYYRIVASNAENPLPQTGLISSVTTLPESTPASDLWRIQYFNQSTNTGIAADDSDPDQDNLPNLLERAFNLYPLTSDAYILTAENGTSGLPNIRAVGDAGNPHLLIEYIRRTAASNSGLIYTPESCGDPSAQNAWSPVTGPETVTPIDSDWERVVIEEDPGSGQPKRFGRLKISTPP